MDLANRFRATPKEGDYYQDDILYCGNCKTPREKVIKGVKVPCNCKCMNEARAKDKADRQEKERQRNIENLRSLSQIEKRYREIDFSKLIVNEENKEPVSVAKYYVENFEKMLGRGQGLIFYGPVGTGKSFIAICIANELIKREVPVIMTSFVRILQDIQSPDMNEGEYFKNLNNASLLIVDDLGTERSTDYANEKVYNVIDNRYRIGKPVIFTTNMMLSDMMNNPDIRYKRIYDRIFEMCYPVQVKGQSWRRDEAARRFDEMKKLTGG